MRHYFANLWGLIALMLTSLEWVPPQEQVVFIHAMYDKFNKLFVESDLIEQTSQNKEERFSIRISKCSFLFFHWGVFSEWDCTGPPFCDRSRGVSCSDFDAVEAICPEAETDCPSLVSDSFRSDIDSWRTWLKSVLVLGDGGSLQSKLAGWLAWLVIEWFTLLVSTLRLPSGVCLSVVCGRHTQSQTDW